MSTLKVNRIEPRTGDTVEIVGFNAGGGLQSVQTFTTSGTWTKPDGVTKVMVEVQGAGGSSNGRNEYDGSSGAGGGYARKFIDVSSISEATVTVGFGGVGTSSSTGNNGGISIWSDGTNTITCNGGSAPIGTDKEVVLGGTSSGGDLNIKGQNGGSRNNYNGNYDASTGGSSFLGLGGRVSNGQSASSDPDATGYGSGGGMRSDFVTTGGAGSHGIVIVWEYA